MLKELTNRGWNYLVLASHEAAHEKQQCIEEGRDFSSLAEEYDEVAKRDLTDPANHAAMLAMFDRTIKLPMRSDYPYIEPSDLDGIRKQRSAGPLLPALKLTKDQLREKLHGAWLGRCCGCLLGKPVECAPRASIRGYLEETGQWPLTYYFRRRPVAQGNYVPADYAIFESIRGCMPVDDDTNYTVVGLNVLKQHGRDFDPLHVGAYWLTHLPMFYTCTAERVAYRNLANLIVPPDSASYRNIYREAIGAQIRADAFGYVCPGNPELAAEFAWRDASISHMKNGIYGEMWVAAMLAAALVTDDMVTIIEAGLSQIPAKSRLHEAIRKVIGWYRSGISIDEAQDRIHSEWNEKSSHWVHTISNAVIVATALLWGGGDYSKTICYAVQVAFDTDCNGATAGSVVGAVLGAKGIDAKWSDPIQDTLETTIAGCGMLKISALVDETVELIEKYRQF